MCGIVGQFHGNADEQVVRRMLAAVEHRGPDDSGLIEIRGHSRRPAGVFGHRRLAIVDLSPGGHQPMLTGDARFTITFNGEIYNYQELRSELLSEGATFSSHSDTEVLLVGWARHGHVFLERLRGMYAFAIWDRDLETGWLVRDPIGIKPLYMAETAAGVVFASEVRSILASGLVEPVLSRSAVAGFLAWGAVPEPETIVEGVRMVRAGGVIEIKSRGTAFEVSSSRTHADLWQRSAVGTGERDIRVAASQIRSALSDSVAAHMVSDVPVGFFLSGGIDSSVVVALAAEQTENPLNTFTVTFEEAAFDERAPALAVARRFRTSHHEVPLTAADLRRDLPAAFAAMDQPTIDGVNTFTVARAVRDSGLKVVLSGLGGDELFAGYPSFSRARVLARIWRLSPRVRGALGRLVAGISSAPREKIEALFGDGELTRAAYGASRLLLGRSEVRRLCGEESDFVTEPELDHLSPLQEISRAELGGYTRDTLLRDSDIFSMAHGLELRVPFLDRVVIAASTSVGDSLKLRRGMSKPLLVEATRDLLPREVWDRRKRGFVFPLQLWLSDLLKAEMDSAFTKPRLERVGLNTDAAIEVWEGYLAGRVGWSRPWAIYVLVRWAEANDAFAARSARAVSAEAVA